MLKSFLFSIGFGIAFAYILWLDGIAWFLPNWALIDWFLPKLFPFWLIWLHEFIAESLVFLFVPVIIPALFAAFVYWRQERGALKKWTLVGVFFFHAIFGAIVFLSLFIIIAVALFGRW